MAKRRTLFLEHDGVSVHRVVDRGQPSWFWFTLDADRKDDGEAQPADFDVRDLAAKLNESGGSWDNVWPPTSDDKIAAVIRSAIAEQIINDAPSFEGLQDVAWPRVPHDDEPF